MQKAVSWTFFLMAVVAGAGLWLRAMPLLPGFWIGFEELRHAHSHLAFLGWVYSTFYLGFVHFFLPEGSWSLPRYRQLFWWTQATAAGMFAAFLLQGYGPVSIGFLTAHTLLAYGFFYCFIKDWKKNSRQASTWFGLAAIAAFVLSSLGPFAIPVIQATEGSNMHLMRMAIHFYLHFHYNGWFVFGLMAILFKILENERKPISLGLAGWQWVLMVPGLVPAYFLFAPSGGWVSADSPWLMVTAWVQWIGFLLFLFQFLKMGWHREPGGSKAVTFLLWMSAVALMLKFSFEVLDFLPGISQYIDRGNHFLTLGYLHLLFLGGITPFIWWFSDRAGWVTMHRKLLQLGLVLFLVGFAGSEAFLFAMGMRWVLPAFVQSMLMFSLLMAMGILLFFIGSLSKKGQ